MLSGKRSAKQKKEEKLKVEVEKEEVMTEEMRDEEDQSLELDGFQFTRVDTLHHDVDVPITAKSGDEFTIDHDGLKTAKVPSGTKGTSIRIKMVKAEGKSSML